MVPARQLSKYYNLRAGHLVQDEKNSSTEPRAELVPTRNLFPKFQEQPSRAPLGENRKTLRS